MHRVLILHCCAVLAAAVTAAPAPRPRPSKVWTSGWDEPVDKARFDRDGAKLTVSGKGQARLLRDAEGDFAVQVHLGDCQPPAGAGGGWWAGLLLVDCTGARVVSLLRAAYPGPEAKVEVTGQVTGQGAGRNTCIQYHGEPGRRPDYLRLERRGGRVVLAWSLDGKEWGRSWPVEIKLPPKVKVGVAASSSAPGPYKAEFDQFQLRPLGAKP